MAMAELISEFDRVVTFASQSSKITAIAAFYKFEPGRTQERQSKQWLWCEVAWGSRSRTHIVIGMVVPGDCCVMNRIYISRSIEQLEQLVEAHDIGVDDLVQIVFELSHRQTARALALRGKAGLRRDKLRAEALKRGERVRYSSAELALEDVELIIDDHDMTEPTSQRSTAEETAEHARLGKIYDRLREKLLDMRLSNPMLSYKHRATSKRQLQIVDEVPEEVYGALTGEGAALEILPLAEPEGIPADEQTEEFRAELEHAKVSDLEYLTELAALENAGRDDEFALAEAETRLRTRLRERLQMPPRPNRKTVSPVEHAKSLGIDPQIELQPKAVKSEHQDRKLQTLKWPDSLSSTLDKVQGDATLSEQEMGLSTLFLVFGFLEWADSKDSSKRLFAPLLLLPVKLSERKTGRGNIVFSLSATSEQADGNMSLAKKLEALGLVLPVFDPAEGAKTPIEDYFDEVNAVVSALPGWKVRRWLTLGHFAFGRFAMYADLDPAKWPNSPVENALVGSVLRGTEINGDGGAGLSKPPDDYDVDNEQIETIAPYLVRDADASQHSAIIDVMKGKNLVIQGPPGTGKSQTIANIIANALASGKKVLFLAEKMAALNVVKRRLDEDKLGHFCLELHSDKSSAKQVIQSLKERHKLGYSVPATRTTSDVLWHEARREIRQYLDALHADTDVGKPFEQIWKAIRTRSELGEAVSQFRKTSLPDAAYTSNSGFERIRDRLAQYAGMRAEFETSFEPVSQSPWTGLFDSDAVNTGIAYPLLDELADMAKQVGRLQEALRAAKLYGMGTVQELQASADLSALANLPVPDEALVAFLAAHDRAAVTEVFAALEASDSARQARVIIEGFSPQNEGQRLIVQRVVPQLSEADIDETPSVTFSHARSVLEQADAVRNAAKAATPHLYALGLTESFPVAGLTMLLILSRIVLKVPHDLRRLVLQAPPGTAATLAPVEAEWKTLNEAETTWRSRFTRASERWPSVDALLAAAAIREKSGISGLLAGFGGDAKTVAEVNALLGIPSTVKLPASDYRDLSNHVRRLASFTTNGSHRLLFGDFWRGLDTPITAFAGAITILESARGLIDGAPGGPDVLRLLDASGPELAQPLVNAQSALSLWGELPDTIRKLAGSASFETLNQHLDITVLSARRMLESGNEQALATVTATWRELHSALLEADQLREVEQRLSAIGTPQLVETVSTRRPEVRMAMSWLAAVQSVGGVGDAVSRLSAFGASAFLAGYVEARSEGCAALAAVEGSRAELQRSFDLTPWSIDQPNEVAARIADLLGRRDELQQWLSVQQARGQCVMDGLEPFIEASNQYGLVSQQLPELFSGLVAVQRADQIRRNDPVLSKATGAALGSLREQFRARDAQRKEADKKTVYAAVIGGQPVSGLNYGSRKTWTERELLQLEFGKERTSVRVLQLIRQAGRSIQSMKPCFMMSPLSLAKFVPAGSLEFDLLVIDEASQMRPEDALGGLLRAKQIVVVGDPKQLPPTDFFQRSGDEAATDEDGVPLDDDDESILEACHKTFRQLRLLKWHYRSRCESLIAFSNKHIYAPEGRQLITFPAAIPGSFSIDRIRVEGAYQQRRNAPEGLRIAEDVILFMQHYADDPKPPTMGVVAMNSDQAELIREQINLLARGDDLVERYRKNVEERGEEFFVKNLENVQGDERDYILISLTYGPKAGEKQVLQRFGPITGKQGHRRLNVLFTRARLRIGLYTSMDASNIKPSETSSRGVHMLQHYLAYVEGGGREAGVITGREPDSDFEIHVAERLRARGFAVEYQVGVSGFRLDLAVLHSDVPGKYLAGIECDGAQYHDSKSARDRDRLRQDILENLGWSILRVWSTDWFDNPDRQTEILVARLVELQKSGRVTASPYTFRTHFERMLDLVNDETRATADRSSEMVDREIVVEGQALLPTVDDTADTTTSVADIVEHPADDGDLRIVEAPQLWLADKFTPVEARQALAAFRENVIASSMAPWEPERSILRASMIETFVEQRLVDEGDWFVKVPQFQRRSTNGAEKARYLSEICDIIGRIV